jgi:hypothetical protein
MSQRTGASKRLVVAMVVTLASWIGWTAPAPAQPAGVEPQADRLLRRMTDYLAGLKEFSVDTHSTIDVVLASGQKIQFDNGAALSVQRPNRFFARRRGDLTSQSFYYDGKTLTLHNPDDKVYASVPAPGTIEAALDFARDALDLVAPASDLVYRNAYEILVEDVTAGFVVGKTAIGGVRCAHLAFRKPYVDWQIWIQEGATPLPRKFVITSKLAAGAPEFTIVMLNWNGAPKLTERAFAFTPPPGARSIEFLRPAVAK